MTDEPKDTANDAPAPVVSDELSTRAAATIEVHSGQALLVAQFADIDQAREAYDTLRQAELKGAADIDGVLVVTADQHGKVHIQTLTDHTTRHGLAWGAIAGAAIGLIFPPSILVGAVVAGSAGAVVGKIYSLARKDAVTEELATVIAPGTSGIVALVATSAIDTVRRAIPQAVVVESVPVDDATADAVKAAAKAVGPPVI